MRLAEIAIEVLQHQRTYSRNLCQPRAHFFCDSCVKVAHPAGHARSCGHIVLVELQESRSLVRIGEPIAEEHVWHVLRHVALDLEHVRKQVLQVGLRILDFVFGTEQPLGRCVP